MCYGISASIYCDGERGQNPEVSESQSLILIYPSGEGF